MMMPSSPCPASRSRVHRPTRAPLLLSLLLASFSPLEAGAQDPLERALAREEVRRGLQALDDRTGAAALLLVEIGGIVSPSGSERERADAVASEMRRIGLQSVRVDAATNAVGVIPGRSGRALVFVSTLDDLATVAEHQRARPGPPVVQGDRVLGPGTNTSSITVSMLEAARAWVATGLQPEHDLVFAAVAEEETGLTGMRALFDEYRERAIGFVDILGDGRSISYGALSIHWWRVVGEGPPGHSLNGGLPNVNQGLARAADRILTWAAGVQDPDMRTVVNVAMLRSGEVFNHKPAEGWFSLDLRSLDGGVVRAMEAEVEAILATVSAETGITLRMDPFQRTPGGQIPGFRNAPLVTVAEGAARTLGLEPILGNAGSSNMNVPMGSGVPAIGLGGERGGERGFPGEWADIPAMMRSAKVVFLLVAALGAGE